MSGWDALRNRKKGEGNAAPKCSRCGKIRVLDPCRDCATPAQAARYPDPPREYEQ